MTHLSVETFYNDLIREVMENTSHLDDVRLASLQRYYHKLHASAAHRPFSRYNWQRRITPLADAVRAWPQRSEPWRMLDAGCGVGTESIFCAGLRRDIDVLGVDLSVERLATAEARCPAWEARLQQQLNLRFATENIFNVLQQQRFDLIWTMEAISHIDPAEDFLEAAYNSLENSGHLIISDSHLLNPAMGWRIYRLRQDGVALRTEKTTAGGEAVSYAQERLFAVPALNGLLKQLGFRRVESQLHVFLPPALFRRWPRLLASATQLERVLDRLPGLRYLGAMYTITATK